MVLSLWVQSVRSYACMHVDAYDCVNARTHARVCVCVLPLAFMCACMFFCLSFVCVFVCVFVCACGHGYTSVCVFVCVGVCVCLCEYVCMCVYVCRQVRVHKCAKGVFVCVQVHM